MPDRRPAIRCAFSCLFGRPNASPLPRQSWRLFRCPPHATDGTIDARKAPGSPPMDAMDVHHGDARRHLFLRNALRPTDRSARSDMANLVSRRNRGMVVHWGRDRSRLGLCSGPLPFVDHAQMTRLSLSRADLASPLHRSLAENLVTSCASRKMTQRELSLRSGIAASHISHIMHARANPTLSTLEKMADVLGITVIELLTPISAKPRLPE